MEDKGYCLGIEMIGRRTFPSLGIIILGIIQIGEDLQEEDKNSNTKIEQEHPQEGDPILLCKCNSCYSNQKTLLEIKDLLSK